MELLYALQLKQLSLFWKRLSLGFIKVLCGPVTFIHTSHGWALVQAHAGTERGYQPVALRGQTHCNSRKLNSKNPQNTTEVELKKSYGTQWTSCGSERVQNMQRTELRHAEKTQMEKTFSIAE